MQSRHRAGAGPAAHRISIPPELDRFPPLRLQELTRTMAGVANDVIHRAAGLLHSLNGAELALALARRAWRAGCSKGLMQCACCPSDNPCQPDTRGGAWRKRARGSAGDAAARHAQPDASRFDRSALEQMAAPLSDTCRTNAVARTASRPRPRARPPARPRTGNTEADGAPGRGTGSPSRACRSTARRARSSSASAAQARRRAVVPSRRRQALSTERRLVVPIFVPGFGAAREGLRGLRPRRRHGRGEGANRCLPVWPRSRSPAGPAAGTRSRSGLPLALAVVPDLRVEADIGRKSGLIPRATYDRAVAMELRPDALQTNAADAHRIEWQAGIIPTAICAALTGGDRGRPRRGALQAGCVAAAVAPGRRLARLHVDRARAATKKVVKNRRLRQLTRAIVGMNGANR